MCSTIASWWMSTKSPTHMFRKDYETAELAAELRASAGVDSAILAVEAGLGRVRIEAYQRKLGLRKITGGGRKQNKVHSVSE